MSEGQLVRRSERGREGENNIILKAITMNFPQFRHERTALSLKEGRGKRKGRKGGETAL